MDDLPCLFVPGESETTVVERHVHIAALTAGCAKPRNPHSCPDAAASINSTSIAPKSSLAKRRPSLPKLQPIDLNTIKTSVVAAKLKTCRPCGNISMLYTKGKAVAPSSHPGTDIAFAQHRATGQHVVLKTLNKRSAFKDRAQEIKWRRATELIMTTLSHNNGFAAILELFEDETNYYVVMEKVVGQDIAQALNRSKQMPVENVKEVLKQLLEAINELHSQNLIHKDIKLENVMLESSTTGSNRLVRIKLVDFDTIHFFDTNTPETDVLGSDQYIAPEAYAGNYSPASDVFAAGVIAYRLLTGTFPFATTIFVDEPGDSNQVVALCAHIEPQSA